MSERVSETAFRRAMGRDLLRWFARHRRNLPWRRRRTPYRVWVAEVMLQQTRAEQAAPYYERFVRKFPTMRALAAASQAEVLRVWEGLGYYGRARALHKAARYLVRQGGGRFPRTLEGLRALPGFGPYTAAAVGSLALGLEASVVDGNVERVVSRLLGVGARRGSYAAREKVRAFMDRWRPAGRAGAFNEAMMELGAVCCTPRAPRCAACPLRRVCRGGRAGNPERYPRPARRRARPHRVVTAGVVVNRKGEILLARRPEGGLLGGLWEFPGGTRERGENLRACLRRELKEELGIRVQVGRPIAVVPHAFSHFTMELHAFWARIARGRPRARECAAYAWVPVARLKDYPMPRADDAIRERVMRIARRADLRKYAP